jgi:DNA-binding transcriptional regulator LsrR (DeoR family)
MKDSLHQELLANAASMFYEQDLTQSQIGEKLGLSRVKIYRLLKEAKEKGIVQIIINWPTRRDSKLEQQLKETFGLKEALVLMAPKQETALLSELGQLAARYLESILKPNSTLAICLGQTTFEVVNAIRPNYQTHLKVVQAIGSMPGALHRHDSSALVRQFAEKVGGEALYLSSPPIADSPASAQIIRNQPDIKLTLEAAKAAEVALIGIGNLDPRHSIFVRSKVLSKDELNALAKEGAVGDIAWRIFGSDGALHPGTFNQRIIGLSLDDLQHIPLTIAVAGGTEKAKAILGAINTGAVNVLCTDDKTAERIIELEE